MLAQNTSRKKWTFRLVAIAIGLLPLLLVEAGLRWLDVGGSHRPNDGFDGTRLFTSVQAHQPSDEVDWEISPRHSNFFCHASFVVPKPSGTRRVFVLGGSTVQGRPYATETAFAKFLELRLNVADTDWRHEVINCGGVSYASDRVEQILHEVLGYQPDAILLYVGHNEFLEDRQEARRSSSTQRWIDWVADRSFTVKTLQKTWWADDKTERKNDPNQTFADLRTRLDGESGMDTYHRDPKWRTRIVENFQTTLGRMVKICRVQRIPLIVCVPASDVVRTPPFKVLPDPNASPTRAAGVNEIWQAIIEMNVDPAQRIRLAQKILRMDSEHAGAHYVLGRSAHDRDSTPETIAKSTRTHLIAARDLDVCPLRATTNIEDSIRRIGMETAMNSPVQVVDIPRLFDRPPLMRSASEDGVADPGWFADHVHPTIGGHRRIATKLSRTFESWGWITRSEESDERYQAAAREHLDGLGEDYFHRGKQRLAGLRRWAAGRAGQPEPEPSAE